MFVKYFTISQPGVALELAGHVQGQEFIKSSMLSSRRKISYKY